MSTTWVMRWSTAKDRLASNIWSRISLARRFRFRPKTAVAQKAQPNPHPAWVETQSVSRFASGMSTLSMLLPSDNPKRNFLVPSLETASRRSVKRPIVKPSAKRARSEAERFVISANDTARFWNNHCQTCLARYEGSLRSTSSLSSSLRLSSLILGFKISPSHQPTLESTRGSKDFVRSKEEIDFCCGSIDSIGAMHRILLNVFAPVLANRARRRFGRVGSAHNFAVLGDRTLTFQHRNENRSGRHVSAQACEEWPLFVNRIENLRPLGR